MKPEGSVRVVHSCMRRFARLLAPPPFVACLPVCLLGVACGASESSRTSGEGQEEPLVHAACGDAPAGRAVGDLAEDFALRDQDGQVVRLSDFCGDVIDIQTGSMWCSGCQTEAARLNEQHARWSEQGFTILSILAENVAGDPVTEADLQLWQTTYDLTTPVLGDPAGEVIHRYFTHEASREMLIGRDGRIRNLRYALDRDVEAALAE